MIDFALDPITNDLVFENFDFDLVEGLDQIMQNLAIRLRFFRQEWYLDITQGIPYYQDVFIKGANLLQIESILKDEIVNTRGISEITRFESNYTAANRRFFVRFEALADSGESILKEMELPV